MARPELVADSRPRLARRWLYAGVPLLLAWIVGQMDKQNTSVLVADQGFLSSMGILHNAVAVGWITTWFLLAYSIGQIAIWPWAVRALGPRKAALYGTLGWALFCFLGGLATSIGWFDVTRVGMGLAEGFLWPVANTLTMNWFPQRERARGVAFWINGIQLGGLFGTALATVALVSHPWPWMFFLFAAISLVFGTGTFWLVVKDYPEQHPAVPEQETEDARATRIDVAHSQSRPLATPYFWLATLGFVASTYGVWAQVAWVPHFLVIGRHIPFAEVGAVVSFAFIGSIVANSLSGYLSDKFHRVSTLIIPFFLLNAVFFLSSTVVGGGVWPLVFIYLAFCFQAAQTPLTQKAMHHFVNEQNAGPSFSLFAGFTGLTAAFEPAAMGYILAATHSYFATFALPVAWMVAAAIGYIPLLRTGI
ncbi:MAG: MFS transporter [Firmicutes bacterium]|nr:MFS transporter [Bacillota bacterium]